MCFSRDSKTIAAGNKDGSIQLIRVADFKVEATIEDHACELVCMAFSVDGRILASGDKSGLVNVFETESYDCIDEYQVDDDGLVQKVAFSDDGKLFGYCGGSSFTQEGEVKVFRLPRDIVKGEWKEVFSK